MTEELYVEGKKIDLLPNSITRTLQINDMGEANNRQSSFSQTIKIPRTAKNVAIFQFLGVSGNISNSPYRRLKAIYLVNGIKLADGYMQIKGTSEYFEGVVYDGLVDLQEKLQGKTLSDLDYSDMNHYLSMPNYIDSWSNTSGYIYGIGNFGLSNNTNKIERQVPSVYLHSIFKKIFDLIDVPYYGSFFTLNEDFQTEVVTPPVGYEVEDIDTTVTVLGTAQTNTKSRNETTDNYTTFYDNYGFTTGFTHELITFENGYVTATSTTNLELNIDVSYINYVGAVNFITYINDRAANVAGLPLSDTTTTKNISLNISVQAGDEIRFKLRGSGTGVEGHGGVSGDPQPIEDGRPIDDKNQPDNDVYDYYRANYSASASISFAEVTGGFLIDFNEMMGDMKCLDFIKEILNRYGLIVKPVKENGGFSFTQMETLLLDKANAEDWTDKLSQLKKENYEISYAKRNVAKYKYPDGVVVESYNGVMLVDNENLPIESDLFVSNYEIATSSGTRNGTKTYLHPVWEEKDNGIIETKESPMKLFRLKKVNGSITSYYFNDGNGYNYTGDIPFLSLDNIQMQYYLGKYYKMYERTLNRFKEIDLTLHLNEIEVYALDFFKLKFFKQLGKYFYLSKLQHKAGEIAKATMIEVNGVSRNLPVQNLGTYNYSMSYAATRALSLKYLTTYTTPQYLDVEGDEPLAVKFISGFNSNIKLYQAGVEIIDDTEILVEDWAVTVRDMEQTTAVHSASFEFQIKDAGSGIYGTAVGTFNTTVREYTNQAPYAHAGPDATTTIDTNVNANKLYQFDGSGSYDYTGSVTYLWGRISSPSTSTVVITNFRTRDATLSIPQTMDNVGDYIFELTITDEFGLSDSDTVSIFIREGISGGGGGGELPNQQ